eukprot:gene7325-2369_t
MHPPDPPGPSHPGHGFSVQPCNMNVSEQLWVLSPGVVPGDSVQTNVKMASANGGCWEIQGCATNEGATVNCVYGCKPLAAACAAGSCCNGAWSLNSNGTITSVMDGQCLQVAQPPGSLVTVGKCRGGGGGDNKDQLFDFVEVNVDQTVAKFAPAASFATGIQQQQKVYTVRFRGRKHQHLQYQSHKQEQQEHDLCIEGAPPAPPACNSFANKTLCPFGRCEWNVTAKACGNWIPPPEICRVPNWAPTYNMSLSTVAMPCDYDGFMSPHWDTIKQFGLVSIDWSNARSKWAATTPMTCEEDLLKQAEIVKAADTLGPQQRVFVYRNTVIAYPWMSSMRTVFNDPAPCGFYLFDQREALTEVNGLTLRDYLIHNVTVSESGLLSPYIDGFYLDDYWSTSMHNGAGGSNDLDGTEDVADLEGNWTITIEAVKQAIVDNNGFTWQMMVNNGEGSGSAMWYRVNKGYGCAAQLRAACDPNSMEQTGALNYDLASSVANGTMSLLDFNQHLASFLLIRGPYAWVGFGWVGCR